MKILVLDVGGTHVKMLASGHTVRREFASGPKLKPKRMVACVKKLTQDWTYDVISLGYPGRVLQGRPIADPRNLGKGWMGFDFSKAFAKPVKIVNDAAMQALGSYHGGRMLFVGLGTGLGSAFIADGVLEPMELSHLPYKKGTYEDYLGLRGLKRLGKKKWRRCVKRVIEDMRAALEPNDVVIGGGNANLLKRMPPGCRAGSNDNAFAGGFSLWKTARKRRTRARR